MIGAEVTEMIQGYGIAKTLETTEAELMHTIFPHPTLSEMMHESVLNAFGKAIHFDDTYKEKTSVKAGIQPLNFDVGTCDFMGSAAFNG